jgi:ABC-type sugar transport system permease subunit
LSTRQSTFDRTEQRDAYVLILPLSLLLAVFIAYPVFSNFYYAFTRWKGFGTAEWIGFRNYARLLQDDQFRVAMRNTFVLILYIPLGTIVPLIISASLREGLKGWAIFKSILYLPALLGPVIIGMLFSIVLRNNGPLNQSLSAVGLGALASNWLGSSASALNAVGIIAGVWQRIGFGCIFFVSAMSSIDSELYDAASIDGAGWWRSFFAVTVPSIRFSIEFWVVLSFITVFARLFGFIFTFTQGGPGFATITLEYGIYVKGFGSFQMGYASAWAVVLFLFCGLIAVGQIRLMRRSNQ